VPVFRYALERWPADNFLVLVYHEGTLRPEQAAVVRELDREGLAGGRAANLVLRTVDLAAAPDPTLLRWWQPLAAATPLPALVLLHPPAQRVPAPAWHAPLSADSVRQLLDSPARRELAGRLLRGESAVWVLLESGDPSQDEPAARNLAARLRHLESTLKLPELNPADVIAGAATQQKLKVAFSILRLSRRDPAEAVLVRLLLNTEEDLAGGREPIVFPVFGQGRVLYALVGRGINDAMIDEAGGFLTGACSCIVKEENPGSDLLLAVDWASLVDPLVRTDEALPPLPGLAEFAAAKSAGGAPPQPGAPAPAQNQHVTNPLIPGILLVVSGGGGLLLGATWWLLRRRG
jgi:hypothetical protein